MSVVELRKEPEWRDIPATLRRIADEIEAGEHECSIAVLVLADERTIKQRDGGMVHEHGWRTYGMGNAESQFVAKGVLATALNRFDSDEE